MRWVALLVLALACQPPAEEDRGAASPASAVPGMETVVVAVAPVHDVVKAFGQVAAEAEPPQVRDARTQVTEAEARLRLAEQQVRRLTALGQDVAPRKELEAARAEQAAAGAAAARARAALAAFGEVGGRTPLATGETWVIANVVQSDVGRVEAASACRFSADAFPGRRFTGEVDSEPGYIDSATGTAPVRLRVSDPGHVLRPGMTGAVTMESGASHEATVVPSVAVVYDGAQAVVFVDDGGGRYVARAVELGLSSDDQIEIVSGISPGARVATTGAASLLSASRLAAGGAAED
ncbi:MAG TPA: efflux RND transporter periplasmic adaptor subunit [Candidatus Nitrosopolaris sp.]|nr:efflux RND transporter periplasmic adaptor subunit [Candidatus Nitrosopolaris sp.]